MLYEGSEAPKVLFISDYQRVHCRAEGKVFSEWAGSYLFNAIKRAGILQSEYGMCCLWKGENDVSARRVPSVPGENRADPVAHLREWLRAHPTVTTLVPLGESALEATTGLKGIGKWQCSVVPATAELGGRKCLPMFHPDYISRAYADHFFLTLGCQKLKRELNSPALNIPERKFLLNPPLKETLEYLYGTVARAPRVAIDWEFGRGQLNTLGFAVSGTEAIAIRCLPGDYSDVDYYKLFAAVRTVAEGKSEKICQHSMVETTWLARYGIELRNVTHDTMWAMKFLNPELDKGLDNVGRLYTPYPYWKDDNDDWSNIRNWQAHLEYNCKDTTGTFAAYEEQSLELKRRGLASVFSEFVMAFQPVIQEMCVTGLLLDEGALGKVREDLVREQDNFRRILDTESTAALGAPINVRSPKQLQGFLKALGMKLPVKTVKGKAQSQVTTDKKALVKLKRKHPDSIVLPALIGISATNKRLSSYIDFDYDRDTKRVHCMLDGCATETGRWAGYSGSWGTGFNPQTVPKAVRSCFIAEPGMTLVQIDLKSAESWYVAMEAPEPTLIELLRSGRDIHRYVASKIFNKPEELIKTADRNLGKKAGHASNYGTGPRTFAEMCLVDMNLYLEEKEAKRVLEAYMETFPGIRRRQENIKREVWNKRYLKTPLGRERYFYGRMDDSTFREAFAYAPQSTIPDITNHLMLSLWRDREHLGLGWDDGGRFLLQVHDSLLLQAQPERVPELAEYCRSLDWHPRILLPGGELKIPVDIEAGPNWKQMVTV